MKTFFISFDDSISHSFFRNDRTLAVISLQAAINSAWTKTACHTISHDMLSSRHTNSWPPTKGDCLSQKSYAFLLMIHQSSNDRPQSPRFTLLVFPPQYTRTDKGRPVWKMIENKQLDCFWIVETSSSSEFVRRGGGCEDAKLVWLTAAINKLAGFSRHPEDSCGRNSRNCTRITRIEAASESQLISHQ